MTRHIEQNSPCVKSKTEIPSTLVATVVTSRDELEVYAAEWNELLSSSDADTIFLTWEWVSAWLEAVYPDAQLFVVVVRDVDGRLIAIAPFYCSDFHLLGLVKYRCLRVIGDCQSGAEYADLIIRRGFEKQAIDIIKQELELNHNMWDCLWIRNIAAWTGAEKRIIEQLGGQNFYVYSWSTIFSAIELSATYDKYLAGLPKKYRHKIKRPENNLCATHIVEKGYCNNKLELGSFLNSLFSLHRKRWNSVGQSGSFVRRPSLKKFDETFAPEALHQGWLRIYTLEVDRVIRAIQYGYVYSDSFLALHSAFCPEGPKGTADVLRSRVIKSCIEEGLKFYDFLGGIVDHKRRFGARERLGANVLIGKRCIKNRLLFLRKISPTGRFIQEGRPANEGLSHDEETSSISILSVVLWILKAIRKFINFILFPTTHCFLVLPLKTIRESQARIPITILRHDLDHACSSEILQRIKGKTKDWIHRWQRGDLCYVAYMNTEPVGHIWICHGEWRLKDDDKGYTLPSRSAFTYDVITREKWRSNGILQALLSRSSIDLRSNGYDYLYGIVSERNIPSQHALTKLGFRRTEHYIRLYRFFKVFNFRHDYVTFIDGCRSSGEEHLLSNTGESTH